jgi:hypothetical protein
MIAYSLDFADGKKLVNSSWYGHLRASSNSDNEQVKAAHKRFGNGNLSDAYRKAAAGCCSITAQGSAGALLQTKAVAAAPRMPVAPPTPPPATVPPPPQMPPRDQAAAARANRYARASALRASTTPQKDYNISLLHGFDLDRLRKCQLLTAKLPRCLLKAEACAQPGVFAWNALGRELVGQELADAANATGWQGGRLTVAATPAGVAAITMYYLQHAVIYLYPRASRRQQADTG